jgi:protease IV
MRDFFKYVFASFLGLILFCTVGLGGLFVLLIALSTAAQNDTAAVEDKTILAFDLSMDITDKQSNSGPGNVLGSALSGDSSTSIALRSVLTALEAAANDDRIVGLYLYGNISPSSSGSGFATLREVREALEAFRETGKPIFAYEMSWTERDYYLTSVANTVVLNPSGLMEMNGFRAETPFFAGALQKYGIGIQVLRAGQYKSFVEPFVRTNRSPEDRQQTQKLLADLWGEFLTTTAASRRLTPSKIQAIADNSAVLLAKEAQTAGLVDKVAYADEVIAELQKLTGEPKSEPTDPDDLEDLEETVAYRRISVPDYAEIALEDSEKSSRNRIAVVYAEGDIVSGDGSDVRIGGDALARQIRALRMDDQVKAIVLRVNSPGGSAIAANLVTREVKLTADVKPVIVSMGSVAASGGYEISAYANKIFASPNTVTGSIGVFSLLPNVQQLANQNGVTWDVVKTGRYADIETISRPKTPQELALEQRIVDQIYDEFIGRVAEARSLPRQRVAEIAQGRVWSGAEAKRIGLVDELGGLEDAIQAAADQAKLGTDWQLDEYPKTRSFGLRLIEGVFSHHATRSLAHLDPITLGLLNLQDDLQTLQSMNDPLGVYTRMSFTPKID